MSIPPLASRRRILVSPRSALTTSGTTGTGRPVVHLPVGHDAAADGEQAGQHEQDPRPVHGEVDDAGVDRSLADSADHERRRGQGEDEIDPDQRLDERERPPAHSSATSRPSSVMPDR